MTPFLEQMHYRSPDAACGIRGIVVPPTNLDATAFSPSILFGGGCNRMQISLTIKEKEVEPIANIAFEI